MSQAIKSDSFSEIKKIIDSSAAPESAELIEEKQLAKLAQHDGWVVLKKYIGNLTQSLEDINKSMMERGATFEDIGKNAVVAQLASDLLNKVIQKVEDAQEAVESTRRTED
jgi:hypothetical protein